MEQIIIDEPNVPAAPLLPPNDPFGDFFSDARSPIDDPTVNGDIAAVLTNSVSTSTIDPYAPELVTLPVPVQVGDVLVTTATVKELTGADEEKLAKAAVSGEPERMLDALLQSGVARIGKYLPNSQDLLDLPVANRDALFLAVRTATYGPEVKFDELGCRSCGENFELSYDLGDVPKGEPLANGVQEIYVPLRRGGGVTLRLPTGSDQMAVLEQIRLKNINRAEQDTLILARCLLRRYESNGDQEVIADGTVYARSLGMADRAAIMKALDAARPGPRMEEASVTCPACEQKTEVPLSIETLFRG